jgi:DNA-binding MurR/RpiR family transcriptional regulator
MFYSMPQGGPMSGDNNAIALLASRSQYLNPALKKIAEYVLENLEKSKTITTKELAAACDVAESTISRFVKEVGFDGFQEFKIALAESLIHSEQPGEYVEKAVYEDITREDGTEIIIEKVYHQNLLKMGEAKKLINVEQLEKAVSIIEKAENLIFVSTGSSSVATNEAIMRFTRAGKRCIFWSDASMQLMVAATAASRDAVVGISDSGKTANIIAVCQSARERSVPIIAVTSGKDSPLDRLADVTLFTPAQAARQANAGGWESTTSKTAQIILVDILYACYAARNYDTSIRNMNKTYQSVRLTRHTPKSL